MITLISFIANKFSGLLSDNTLTKKASLNAIASLLDYGARWFISFILNPLLVTGLGDFGYGAWQVLIRLIGYISPAGGRPTQALKWTIANRQASTDFHEKRQQVGSAVAVWLMFLPILSVLGGILAWFIPTWLDAPVELISGVRWAAALLVTNLIFTNLAEIPQSVLRGENLGYKRMGLTTMFVLLGGSLMALAMYFKTGLVGVAFANLVTTVLTGVLFLRIVRSYVKWFGITKPVFAAVRRFLDLSWWFLAWNLVLQLLKAGDVVILGIFDSAELVTHYSLTRYIPETIIGVVAIIVFGITPGMGGIVGKGDFEKAVRVRGELMIFTWLIVTVFGSTMLLWNHSFVQLWVGNEHYAGTVSNLLIILMVSQFVFIRNDANIIDVTLNLKSKALLGILSAGCSAALAGVLVGIFKLGIVGLTLGFIAGQLVLTIGYPLIVGRFFRIPVNSQFRQILRPGFVTLLLFVSQAVLGDFLVVKTWLSLVLSVGLTVGLLSILTFYLGVTNEQRKSLLRRIRKVLTQNESPV
jgi:O-antigen/teichoic acid export membrane protein